MINTCKDPFYDLLSRSLINWRLLLYNVVKRFKKLNLNRSEDDEGNKAIKCFIGDDSDIEKRGRKFEGISRIFNHVIHRHILGFKLLVLGLWDGKSFIPVDFSYLLYTQYRYKLFILKDLILLCIKKVNC